MSNQESKKYNQYFSARPSLNITMPLGERIRFVGGTYITDSKHEIEFLDEQIKLGHGMIFTRKGQETVTSEALDPLAAIKKKAVEEYLANQQRAMDPKQDMGNTSSNISASVQTTRDLSSISVGSKSSK